MAKSDLMSEFPLADKNILYYEIYNDQTPVELINLGFIILDEKVLL